MFIGAGRGSVKGEGKGLTLNLLALGKEIRVGGRLDEELLMEDEEELGESQKRNLCS